MTKITKKPDGSITFELTIPAATIASEYKKALTQVAKTAQIKGFRPGKAPLQMVEAQTDKSRMYSSVLDQVLSPTYSEVIHEHKLVPLLEPRVTPKSMEEGKDWVMEVIVAVSPEIDLGDYTKYIGSAIKKHAKELNKTVKDEITDDHQPKADPPGADKLNVIFDALLDKAKIEVSPFLIEEETKSALQRLSTQLNQLKLSVEDYVKSIKKTTAELVEEYKKSAESNLKLEFILQKLIEDKKPIVSEAEIAEMKPQKGQEGYAKYVLQKRKVLDFLAEL